LLFYIFEQKLVTFLKSTQKLIAMVTLVALIVATAMTISFWSFNQVKLASEAREHANLSIKNADSLLSTLKDAETSQRGYLLTGDETFIDSYSLAIENISAKLKALQIQTKIKAAQEHLEKVAPLIEAKIAMMMINIELRRNLGLESAAAGVSKGQGKKLMLSIQNELDEFSKIEHATATKQDVKLQDSMHRMFNIIIFVGVIWTLFALAFIYLVYRRSQQKIKDLVHLETQSLLKIQEDTNNQLMLLNSNLEISEEKLAVTINSIGDAVIATDDKGFLTMLNPLAEKLTGWKKTDAIGLPISDVFHIVNQETRQFKTIPILETLEHGTIQGMANHTVLIARDGSECSIADSCAPIRDKTGKMVGSIMVFRDVSKEYATQRQLSDSSAIIEAILNSVVDGIITFHARDGIIKTVNPSAEKMFGFDATELIGKNFSILVPELDQNKRDGTLDAYKASKEDIALGHGRETIGWKKENIPFPVEIAVNEMWLGGIRFFSCILRDITLRKLAEENQMKMDEELKNKNAELTLATSVAEKANLAKSDFLSSMSHELRTPLGAILGFAQLIESGTPSPTATQKKSIDQILKAGWYLLDLINEILDLALIESGKMALSLEPVSITEVMRECKAMIEPEALKRNVKIHFNEFDTPYFVKADHTRVKQIVINLLSNAIKYNKVEGSVTVEYSLTDNNSIRISIKDTGAGLTQELIQELFQPFNRLGQNAKAEVGTGIGLVVCKRLVELMHGRIGVESIVGEGSTFWIELNLIIEAHLKAQDKEIQINKAKPDNKHHLQSLLYIEDNPANLMLVEDIIARRDDLTLFSARDGNEGIKMANELLPDLILMDINLPGISGLDALIILAKDKKTAHIPVIALSANAIPHDIERGLKAGFFRYLTKPIRVKEFMETLDSALQFAKDIADHKAKKE
jgi:PAS domain S-box-containing protein